MLAKLLQIVGKIVLSPFVVLSVAVIERCGNTLRIAQCFGNTSGSERL